MAFLDFLSNIVLQNSTALLAVPCVWLIFLLLAWRRRFKPFGAFLLRLTMLVLVMVALAQPVHVPPTVAADTTPVPESVVLLVDQSASIGQAGQQALQQEAARLAANLDEAYTLVFADQATLIAGPYLSPATANTPQLNQDITHLAEALSAGAELLNQAENSRMVLLSDGLATAGETSSQLAKLTAPVDVLLPTQDELDRWRGSSNELSVSRLVVPSVLRDGERFDIEVVVQAKQAANVTLNLTQNGETLAQDVVAVEAGFNTFRFASTALTLGGQTFQATIAADETDDVWSENNRLSAFAEVYPPPRLLLVAEDLLHASEFATLFYEAGFRPDVSPPERLPSRMSELEPYAGMVLLDVPARTLAFEQMVAIEQFVQSLGRGLLVTGGRNSLSLGNYAGSRLADVLPVTMEPPPREERPPVALLLVIDHSGSMAERRGNLFTKLAMAKEAAIRATDILGPEDLLGILIFDNTTEWIIPFQAVSDGAALLNIQQRIATITPGGGTRILEALQASLPELARQPTPGGARHAVLLTDGRSFDGLDAEQVYNDLISSSLDAGITLSTIAIGSGADQELMEWLAGKGKGRYHYATVPDELPALTVSESDILRSNSLQEARPDQPYQATVYAPHPMIRGLFMGSVAQQQEATPPLFGYLALTPKPLAEVALQIGPGDPLLTVWGYGLGRAAVWTSDSGQAWTDGWLAWPEASRFWGQLLGYTLPAPDLGLLQLETSVEHNGAITMMANAVDASGQTVDLARTQATLRFPNGQQTDLRLFQVAPGEYRQSVKLPEGEAYQLHVSQSRSASEEYPEAWQAEASTGFAVPYPSEYNLPTAGTGETLLREIAATTGGQPFRLGDVLDFQAAAIAPPVEQPDPLELWPYLLAAAIALWPLEIAWRRWGRMRIQ